MSQIETPLTTILIPVFLILFTYNVMSLNAERIEKAASEKALAEQTALDEARQLLIDARTLDVTVKHDNDPETNTIAIVLSAASSYDNENDDMKYYWKQISGTNVANIRESNREAVLNFDGKAGDYGFQLTITDNYGASCVDTVLVNVNPEPNSCPVVIIKK
jgi:chitinase